MDASPIAPELERQLAIDLFNRVWTLMETSDRTAAQDDEMLHAAHASRHHWATADGGVVNVVRGEWQCSRVYAVLGRAEPCLHHARRCLDLAQGEVTGLAEFDRPFAQEAMARALLLAGDPAGARTHAERARELAAAIADDDDRELVESDLASLAWPD